MSVLMQCTMDGHGCGDGVPAMEWFRTGIGGVLLLSSSCTV
jgi:hypothetical protein